MWRGCAKYICNVSILTFMLFTLRLLSLACILTFQVPKFPYLVRNFREIICNLTKKRKYSAWRRKRPGKCKEEWNFCVHIFMIIWFINWRSCTFLWFSGYWKKMIIWIIYNHSQNMWRLYNNSWTMLLLS